MDSIKKHNSKKTSKNKKNKICKDCSIRSTTQKGKNNAKKEIWHIEMRGSSSSLL